MTIVTHKRTLAKCTVVGQFRDGDVTYYTLRENVATGEYSRTFTAVENELDFPAMAEVISFSAARERRKPEKKLAERDVSETVETTIVEPKERDPNKVYINDSELTAQGLSSSVIQGIGPITAGRILELRRNFPGGKFTSIDDLSSIKGINWENYTDTISFE